MSTAVSISPDRTEAAASAEVAVLLQGNVGKAPFLRRFIAAWVYDYLVALWVATILLIAAKSLTRLLTSADFVLPVPFLVLVFGVFLFRDCWPRGLSAGKNLLSLVIVDKSGRSRVTVRQSLIRNLLLLAPYFLYQLALFTVNACHLCSGAVILSACKTFAFTYVIVISLLEAGLIKFSGVRLADRLACTEVRWKVAGFPEPRA